LNDGYFLFKSPSYHHWDKNRVVFLGFNRAHRGAAFYLSFNFKSENDAEDLKMDTVGDNIVHSISKDGIFVTCILNAKRKRLIDDNNGKTWINFKI
jgi:hypothetical protein